MKQKLNYLGGLKILPVSHAYIVPLCIVSQKHGLKSLPETHNVDSHTKLICFFSPIFTGLVSV